MKFSTRAPNSLIGVFIKVHSTPAANHTWSMFMPLYGRRFNRYSDLFTNKSFSIFVPNY